MDQQEQQLIDRIKQAQNILVTVSVNPSVDQLAAAIGLTVALNKLDKHGTAVFSGQTPSTIEFLKPETTLEKTTDSLRDFIIALDKSKADKLRYKVEDQVVRIFITPYRTSLSQADLDFSQGDFNVDVVIALGVAQQQDIDAAITAHGRILHDATVASVSAAGQADLGTINWADTNASSLSEMMLSLIDGLDKKLLDGQIATALLTGIVASTDRFRNEKTSPNAMSASAELMAAGANQQLIATELEAAPPTPEPEHETFSAKESHEESDDSVPAKQAEPGELDIDHDQDEQVQEKHDDTGDKDDLDPAEYRAPAPEPDLGVEEPPVPEPHHSQIDVDENGMLSAASQAPLPTISRVHGVESDEAAGESGTPVTHHERMTGLPSLGDVNLTANTEPEGFEPTTEELTLPAVSAPLLSHNETVLPAPPPAPDMKPDDDPFIPQAPLKPAPQDWQPPIAPPAPFSPPAAPYSIVPPAPPSTAFPMPAPPVPLPSAPVPPLPPVHMSAAPAISPASASMIPDETLEEIEEAVHSPHLQYTAKNATEDLADARSAVQAAFNGGGVPSGPPQPIVALNAQPLGPELHPVVPNTGFSEPTPGNTPADATLDMPLPSNPFGPGQQTAPPSAFPGTPPQQGANSNSAPPVPPPFVPPLP